MLNQDTVYTTRLRYLKTPGLLAFCWLVGLLKWRIIEPSLTAFIRFPFPLVFTCTHVHSRNVLHNITKYIIINFGRLQDVLWNVFLSQSLQLPVLLKDMWKFLQSSSSWKSLKAQIFTCLITVNINKTAHSEIYQWHHHLNLNLWIKSYTYFLRHITILK